MYIFSGVGHSRRTMGLNEGWNAFAGEIAGEANDIHTFGVENILICRRDLGEDLVYRLTAGLFEQEVFDLRNFEA